MSQKVISLKSQPIHLKRKGIKHREMAQVINNEFSYRVCVIITSLFIYHLYDRTAFFLVVPSRITWSQAQLDNLKKVITTIDDGKMWKLLQEPTNIQVPTFTSSLFKIKISKIESICPSV